MKTNKSRANKNQIRRVLLIKRQNKTKDIESLKERKWEIIIYNKIKGKNTRKTQSIMKISNSNITK